MGTFTRRHLPHWQPANRVFFVTYRLHGSLPRSVIERLRLERERLRGLPPRPGEREAGKKLRDEKQMFALMEEALAAELRICSSSSARWLGRHEIARLVRENLSRFDAERYHLHRYCIMPNHVHLLLEPLPLPEWMKVKEHAGKNPIPLWGSFGCARLEDRKRYWPLAKILKTAKGYTAREANRILGKRGTFWQQESYDHWVRDQEEYGRIVEYIDKNPVTARLCRRPWEWQWSSAAEERESAGADPT